MPINTNLILNLLQLLQGAGTGSEVADLERQLAQATGGSGAAACPEPTEFDLEIAEARADRLLFSDRDGEDCPRECPCPKHLSVDVIGFDDGY